MVLALCLFCAMRVFDVRASSSPQGYLVPNFIAQLACGEKSSTQSLTQSHNHSPSLFDVPGNEALDSEYIKQNHSYNKTDHNFAYSCWLTLNNVTNLQSFFLCFSLQLFLLCNFSFPLLFHLVCQRPWNLPSHTNTTITFNINIRPRQCSTTAKFISIK